MSATSSQGWSRSAPPSSTSIAPPVSATPAPMTIVPLRSSQSRTRVARPGSRGTTGSPSRPRVRSVNGRRNAGRNSEIASRTWLVEQDREQGGGVHGPGRSRSSATHSPSSVLSSDPQLGGEERATHLGLAVDVDARREQPTAAARAPLARPDRDRELRREVDEQAGDEVREHEVERSALDRQAATRGRDRERRCARRSQPAASTAIGSVSTPDDRRCAQQRRGDREDPGAGAHVEDRTLLRRGRRPPSARGPRGRAASSDAGRSRMPCPGRAR